MGRPVQATVRGEWLCIIAARAIQPAGRRAKAWRMFGSIKVFARMFRLIATLVVILIVVVGALFLLGGRATEQPTRQIEQQVSLANLQ
jgi:hypothetical protein